MARSNSELATISAVAQLLAIVLIVAGLFFARDVFIPLTLGLLLSFLLSPLVNRLQRWRVPNIMAVVTTAAIAFVFLATLFTLLGRELTTLVGDLPKHKHELVVKARSVAGMSTSVGGSLEKLADEVTEAMENGAVVANEPDEVSGWQQWTDKVFPRSENSAQKPTNDGKSVSNPLYVQEVKDDLPLASWASAAGTLLGPLATAGLVSVFALFMLIHREDLRDRIIGVVSHGNYVMTTEALDEASGRISRYLIAQSIINASYGLIMTIGLVIIGATMTEDGSFPNAILWGVLAMCFRFVPYVGPTVASMFPLAIALSVFPGYSVALAVFVFIIALELISNNIMEPWLYGASTGISAVAVIIAAVFWAWLWGPVGLLLSTPLTVCLVVLGRYVPRFKIISTLLGEEVEVKTSMRFYQRMLAGDEHRATELLTQHVKETDFKTVCDEIIIPTIKRIRHDQEADRLSEADANRLLAMSGGLIAKLDEQTIDIAENKEGDDTATAIDDQLPVVVGCTSHDVSESLILNLLRIDGAGQFILNAMESDMLPQELAQHVAAVSPKAVAIVVMPKGGFAQSRYLCSAIRKAGYSGPILICCPGKFRNFDKLFMRFRKAGASYVTTTYAQTRSKLDSTIKRRPSIPLFPQTM